jgi:cation diffusion facilitator family transporter
MKVAKKYNSQALEADALHFSTDILSSFVVLLGLIGAEFGFYSADSFAALVVALIVIGISIRLGKRAIDVLLDRSPEKARKIVKQILENNDEVLFFHDVKIRTSGATTFIAATIHVEPDITIQEAHRIAELIEAEIKKEIPDSQVLIHQEPDINRDGYRIKLK